jgi:hypothetical protein
MPTLPPTVTPLGTPPSRDDPANFATRGDAFLGSLPTWSGQVQAVGAATYANAVEAETAATQASANANAASVAAQNAVTAGGAAAWVSGQTYAVGATAWSPITGFVYRRTVAGSSGDDPSIDPTHWRLAGSNKLQMVLVAGTSVTAVAGAQYVLTSPLQTTVTLPTGLQPGDTVGVIVANGRVDNRVNSGSLSLIETGENLLNIGDSEAEFALTYVSPGVGWRLVNISLLGGAQAVEPAVAATVTADIFRNSNLRGVSLNDVEGAPLAANLLGVFSRFRSNVCRRFLTVTSTGLGTPYTVPPSFFTSLDADIAALAALGCKTVLVLNPARPGVPLERQDDAFFSSTAAKAQFAQVWAVIAARYKGNEDIAAFDIINEPVTQGTSDTGTELIVALQEQCIDAIRTEDPIRVCMVSCGWNGAPGGYTNMRPVRQSNIVYTVHFYQPFGITHAQVSGQPAYTLGYPSTDVVAGGVDSGITAFGATMARRERMLAELGAVVSFQKRNNCAIFVGEYTCGPMANTAAQPMTAANWVEDAISVFEELGWSHNFWGLWFPPNPWSSLELPRSGATINYNNGGGDLSGPMSTLTGGGPHARTIIAPVSNVLERNELFRTAVAAPRPLQYVEETFEGTTLGRLGQAPSVAAGMTAVLNSTAAPKSGTKHARFTHVSGAGPSSSFVLLQDSIGTGYTERQYFMSFDVALRVAIGAGNTAAITQVTQEDGAEGAYMTLKNVTGTNTWQLEQYLPYDYGGRPFYLINGMVLPVGSYTRIKMAWMNSSALGRLRVWQDGRLLVDINTTATLASEARASWLWRVKYGLMESNQIGQTLDFDNVRYSVGADLT